MSLDKLKKEIDKTINSYWNGRLYAQDNSFDFINVSDIIEEALDKAHQDGKEEKLASTYKSSKMYLMGFKDGKEEALKAVEETWIEYKKEKPEFGKLVLIYRDIENGQIYEEIWSEECRFYADMNDITHWKPITYPKKQQTILNTETKTLS